MRTYSMTQQYFAVFMASFIIGVCVVSSTRISMNPPIHNPSVDSPYPSPMATMNPPIHNPSVDSPYPAPMDSVTEDDDDDDVDDEFLMESDNGDAQDDNGDAQDDDGDAQDDGDNQQPTKVDLKADKDLTSKTSTEKRDKAKREPAKRNAANKPNRKRRRGRGRGRGRGRRRRRRRQKNRNKRRKGRVDQVAATLLKQPLSKEQLDMGKVWTPADVAQHGSFNMTGVVSLAKVVATWSSKMAQEELVKKQQNAQMQKSHVDQKKSQVENIQKLELANTEAQSKLKVAELNARVAKREAYVSKLKAEKAMGDAHRLMAQQKGGAQVSKQLQATNKALSEAREQEGHHKQTLLQREAELKPVRDTANAAAGKLAAAKQAFTKLVQTLDKESSQAKLQQTTYRKDLERQEKEAISKARQQDADLRHLRKTAAAQRAQAKKELVKRTLEHKQKQLKRGKELAAKQRVRLQREEGKKLLRRENKAKRAAKRAARRLRRAIDDVRDKEGNRNRRFVEESEKVKISAKLNKKFVSERHHLAEGFATKVRNSREIVKSAEKEFLAAQSKLKKLKANSSSDKKTVSIEEKMLRATMKIKKIQVEQATKMLNDAIAENKRAIVMYGTTKAKALTSKGQGSDALVRDAAYDRKQDSVDHYAIAQLRAELKSADRRARRALRRLQNEERVKSVNDGTYEPVESVDKDNSYGKFTDHRVAQWIDDSIHKRRADELMRIAKAGGVPGKGQDFNLASTPFGVSATHSSVIGSKAPGHVISNINIVHHNSGSANIGTAPATPRRAAAAAAAAAVPAQKIASPAPKKNNKATENTTVESLPANK
jgi:hypothetical protein